MNFETLTTALGGFMSRVMSFELPIPDVALVLGFALALYAIKLAARSSKETGRADLADLYQSELLLANRRTQQAKGDLRKAHLAMERERQKRRREAGRTDVVKRRTNLLVIDQHSQQI